MKVTVIENSRYGQTQAEFETVKEFRSWLIRSWPDRIWANSWSWKKLAEKLELRFPTFTCREGTRAE